MEARQAVTEGGDVGTDGSVPSILLPSACQRICLYPNQETVNRISETGARPPQMPISIPRDTASLRS